MTVKFIRRKITQHIKYVIFQKNTTQSRKLNFLFLIYWNIIYPSSCCRRKWLFYITMCESGSYEIDYPEKGEAITCIEASIHWVTPGGSSSPFSWMLPKRKRVPKRHPLNIFLDVKLKWWLTCQEGAPVKFFLSLSLFNLFFSSARKNKKIWILRIKNRGKYSTLVYHRWKTEMYPDPVRICAHNTQPLYNCLKLSEPFSLSHYIFQYSKNLSSIFGIVWTITP